MRYLIAILALGVLIALHELGHLLLARLFRVRVNKYAIGFGPALLSFRRGATEYSLRAIPLGGFVQIHGMNPYEEGLEKGDPESYASLAAWKRALILFAGPFTNYVVAVALLCVVYATGTHVPVPRTIGTVAPGSEAARAQLRPGDVVLSVDGARVDTWTGFAERLADRQGQTVVLSILRHGDMMNVEVRPREESGTGRIGVEQQYVYKRLPFKEAVGNAFLHTQRLAVEGLGLAWRLVRGKPGVELTGPIAVTRSVGEAAGQSEDTFLRMVVALSIALAVFNLLPVPALDGGRMLFVLVETVTGRALPVGLETLLHLLGFLLLMGLTVWVAVSDVRKWLGREPTPPPAETRPPAAAPPPPRLDGGTAPDAGR